MAAGTAPARSAAPPPVRRRLLSKQSIRRAHALMSRRLLQITVTIVAFVPILAGLTGMLRGPAMVDYEPVSATLDSYFSYLSGLLLVMGLAFWTTVPSIERKGPLFRLLAAMVVVGGIGRLISIYRAGWPDEPNLAAIAIELGVTPFCAVWQYRVAKRAAAKPARL